MKKLSKVSKEGNKLEIRKLKRRGNEEKKR